MQQCEVISRISAYLQEFPDVNNYDKSLVEHVCLKGMCDTMLTKKYVHLLMEHGGGVSLSICKKNSNIQLNDVHSI